MASIRRTDIMQKKYSKIRPGKSERERIFKRYEVFKWRDSRRVYLAGSFDRWRKLRSSLKLKDSSLAWHLMEAHEKGHCTLCRQHNLESSNKIEAHQSKCEGRGFLPSLMASLRQLCHKHYHFEECIEVVGLLCLEFDRARKENFSINEVIESGLKPCFISRCVHKLPDHSVQQSSSSLSQADILVQHEGSEHESAPTALSISCPSIDTELLSTSNSLSEKLKQKLLTVEQESFHKDDTVCAVAEATLKNLAANQDSLSPPVSNSYKLALEACSSVLHVTKAVPRHHQDLEEENTLMDSSLCSDSDQSLEIDIEKMDTLQKNVNIHGSKDQNNVLVPKCKHAASQEDVPAEMPHADSDISDSMQTLKGLQCNKDSALPLPKSEPVSEDQENFLRIHQTKQESFEMPLDMSILKANVKQELDVMTSDSAHDDGSNSWSPNNKRSEGETVQFLSSGKRKIHEMNVISPQCSRQSPFWPESFQSWPGKVKEEGHPSIPWQRRDMSRKEEYEFLEMNPFSDLAEFSQRYPHVHQRTYYRWKRRIKEEYIILEQCPSMSFHEFSSIVLQAKESVYCHWRSLIAQGKGFFAPSDTSKRLDAKYPIKPNSPHNSAYAYMQKNLAFTYEQFCQQYPGTPVGAFNVLKRKAMQEFWLFHQNQHMSHRDFSKLVNVSEDVYSTWKECVESFRSHTLSQNLKTVSSKSVSPNPQKSHPSFQSVDSPSSSVTEAQSQAMNGNLYKIKNSSASFKDSSASHHTEVLSDSVARSLSASYFAASLQNMLFPWHGYYGMTSHVGQQMLPMMMWPGMMGLAGSMTNSLGLLSSSAVDNIPRPNTATGFHSSLLGSISAKSDDLTLEETHNNSSDEQVRGGKRLTGGESQERYKNHMHSDCEKRQKMSHDRDDVDFSGSASRSRKQNKQEYIYYLKNPELCFKELESLFPSISLRTFYRWRKEMNAAVLLLEENKNMTFHQFQMVFPDIPEDIFELWKSRGVSLDPEKQKQQLLTEELNCSSQSLSQIDFKPSELSQHGTVPHLIHNPATDGAHLDKRDVDYLRESHRERYLFVQKNPNIDFVTFSELFPDSSRSNFHRWRKELKDAVKYLKTNPVVNFSTYKATIDSTVSEDVFNAWKKLANNNYLFEDEISHDNISAEEKEIHTQNHINNKGMNPEYRFLQLNPYIEFSEFICTFSDVQKHIFDQWKEEIQQILKYIHSEPTAEFQDITAMFPEVSEDIFIKWKQLTAAERENSGDNKKAVECEGMKEPINTITDKAELDESMKNLMTKALLYLMENPTISYSQFKAMFDFVPAATFDQWLSRIKTVILYIASNPCIDYTTFSASIKDISQDIFNIWKKLDPNEIAAMDLDCEEPVLPLVKAEPCGKQNISCSEVLSLEAFEYCQRNPTVPYSTFQSTYPTVPEKIFRGWMLRIQKQQEFIRENPDIEFSDFVKAYPHTSQNIFYHWKSDCLDDQIQHFLHEPSHETQSDAKIHEESFEEDAEQHIFRDTTEMAVDAVENNKEKKEVLMKSHVGEYVKENIESTLENGPKESSLSKLAKFADANALAYSKKQLTGKLSSTFDHLLKNNNNKIPHMEPSYSPSDAGNFFTISNAAVSAHDSLIKSNHSPGMNAGEVYSANSVSTPLHTSSLSALMAMSRSEDSQGKGSHALSPQKDQTGNCTSPVGSGSLLWRKASNGPVAIGYSGGIKEDDEAFSSQRQKKMSRAEYLFVKDNPDVDSQEFSRIFPGVSARTFYRWKKEIKAQLQLA